jgi:5-methylcytosine-specific restriction protein A
MKLCTVCGVVTSRPGSRCTEHARQSNRSRHNALYSTRAWQRLSVRVLRAWRGQHGDWCPGYQRDAHPASDLTADHIVPLAAGGAPLDFANLAVLCRSCNSTKGARPSPSVARGRAGAIVGTPLAADRWGSPLARSVAPDRAGVTVNAIRAGVTVTPALLKIPEAQTMIDITMKRNPTGRMTTPQDVANAILALSGEGTDFINGDIISVDGGEFITGS